MTNFNEAYSRRTKAFAIAVIKWYKSIKKDETTRVMGRQLIRSASSVAANFRAACRARSKAEYYAKLCIVVEECDESLFWLECFREIDWIDQNGIPVLYEENISLLKVLAKVRKNNKLQRA